jgi:signal transduction histidine kinase
VQYDEKCSVHVSYLENTLHDIKTPISIVSIMLQSIVAEAFEDDQRRYFETSRKYTSKIIDILQDVNDYNKIIRHDYKPRLKRVDIVRLVQETVDSAAAMALRKNIEIVFDTDLNMKKMFTDDKAVEKIVLNLLSNAVKFVPMYGEIVVKVSLDRWDEAVITVSDDGDGFSKEFLKEGVNRYRTLSNEYNPNGSGIGLSMVKEMVSALNGTVSFANNENGGAVVAVVLPVIEREDRGEDIMSEFDGIQMELM